MLPPQGDRIGDREVAERVVGVISSFVDVGQVWEPVGMLG